jgi:casein kinase II subunit beta
MGQSDLPHKSSVKMYCAKCEDLYNPKATRHGSIDGAYFGSSFHNILFQVYPALIPEKSRARHVPRVFGFKLHVAAALARWQDGVRGEQRKRLREAGVENVGFVDDGNEAEEEDEDGFGAGQEAGEGGADGAAAVAAAAAVGDGAMEEVKE